MTLWLFLFGAFTSFASGLNVFGSKSTDGWKTELVWVLGGTIGAAMMTGAIYLRGIGL